jgi:IS66 C-terminal element/Transposase IS66 family
MCLEPTYRTPGPSLAVYCSSTVGGTGVQVQIEPVGCVTYCLSNNAAERVLRGIALGRKSWLFAGSDRGGERAAIMLTLIHTAKLSDVDPQAWFADVLARIADHKITDLAALLPWNWRSAIIVDRAA